MSIKAMKQALEALEIAAEGGGVDFYGYAQDLRQAIAEAEKQEPVAKDQWWAKELEGFWGSADYQVTLDTRRAAKTALGIIFKPADKPLSVEQEPVAWRVPNWGHSPDEFVYRDFDDPVIGVDGKPSPNNEPLYTHPQPKREWVGLTDEEMRQVCYEIFSYDPYEIARVIEAKLKEKNT